MINQLFPMVVETLRRPRASAERVLAFDFDRGTLWSALMLVAILSVLGSQLTLAFVPDDLINGASPLPTSPIVLALIIWGLLVVTVFSTYYLGRAFGGTGSMKDSLLTSVWLQFVMLIIQVGQLILFILAPILAILVGYIAAIYIFYVFLNYVRVMHGFSSLGMVFGGAIVSIIGLLFGLSLLIGLIAAVFGLEIPTNV